MQLCGAMWIFNWIFHLNWHYEKWMGNVLCCLPFSLFFLLPFFYLPLSLRNHAHTDEAPVYLLDTWHLIGQCLMLARRGREIKRINCFIQLNFAFFTMEQKHRQNANSNLSLNRLFLIFEIAVSRCNLL